MGYELEPTGELRFFSRKLGILKKAIGNTVWVIQGTPTGKKTTFSLCGAYTANHVEVEDPSSNLYVISGPSNREFSPPVPLNGLDWFPALLKSQSNFSLGFNRVSDEQVVHALSALQIDNPPSASILPDVDLPLSGTEGAARLVSHLRRERNQSLVDKKKMVTLSAKGSLSCEACDFNFSAVYGDIGIGFCEVHHIAPLSASADAVTTTLDDLAVLCSNCHRIIHRSSPMLSVSQLADLVRNHRS